ncbi:hypothetical protein KY290_024476 [Solanum tuberosum]|uniref:Uncharacterized protein n=1 Tax=Solanum tuberosum TaxID=4113 RepID=A0ABQ7USU7_SOLTU|nr:hypothetical protein KY290_024476 [Solanum tuberosum]
MEKRELEMVLLLLNGCFRWLVAVFRRWLVCCFDGKSEKLEKGSSLSVVFVCWRKWKKTNGVLVVDSSDFGGTPVSLSPK